MQLEVPYILLADDDPEDRQLLADEFARQDPGIPIRQLGGGYELLLYLNDCPLDQLPAVLLLDFQMPDLTGPQILLHLAANNRYDRMVKVMWSTSRRTKDIAECKQLGAAHYLVKPATIEEMTRSVHEITVIFNLTTRVVQ